jgi:hypothetical protein
MTTRAMAVAALVLSACEARAPAAGPFDGAKALEYIGQQLAFGPRIPGTAGHRRAGDWIAAMMRARADTVIEQRWTHVTASGDSLPMRNILARFQPDRPDRVLYVAHWDTRPRADSETDSARRLLPVPGANDGASGVALLIALGDQLASAPLDVGVDFLFVDGEDYGQFGPPDVDVLIGATYFAEHLPSPGYRPLFGVLWDMIGDRDLRIQKETWSVQRAGDVVERVWRTASALGYERYFDPTEYGPITDDHLPLQAKGIPIVDVIDIAYAAHHTADDTIDKVSALSLKIVGDVAWALLAGDGR